jgi:hypothetical protein
VQVHRGDVGWSEGTVSEAAKVLVWIYGEG